MTDQAMPYGPEYAGLYDEFYATKPYREEAGFVSRGFAEAGVPAGGRVLDLACGTGGHALELAALGYAVVGVDVAESMLEEARKKSSAQGLTVRFTRQDLRLFDEGESAFDAAICLFDSLGYLVTDADISAALARIHMALRPGGVFAVEVWHRPAVLRAYERVRVGRFGPPGREIVRLSETRLDLESRTATVTYTVFTHALDGRWEQFIEVHRNRFFSRKNLAELLTRAGLVPLRWSAGYSDGPVTREAWHLVVICRKEAPR